MSSRRKSARTLGEHSIFGDEEAAALQAEVKDLRELVSQLGERVHSQFTTIAAHAEIAREQAQFARDEARADLERTREMLVDLLESTRRDVGAAALHVPGSAPGPSLEAQRERFDAIDRRLDQLTQTVTVCFDRQRELADTMAALIDTIFADQRGEPAVGLSVA